jgi:WD40 repeat protein
VASASFENEIRLSSPALGTVPRTLRCRGRIAADMQVLDLAMSPDGRLVAAHCGPYNDGYRIERGVQVWKVPSGAPSIVLAVQEPPLAFDPSGTRLATVDHWKGPRVRVSEIHGAPEFLPPGGRPAPTDHLAFSHDGNRLAAAGADGAIRVWDVHANREPIVLSGHPGSTRHVAFSPDGRLIASTGSDGAIRIWSPVAGVEPVVLAPYSDPYASVAFTPDLQHLATVHTDGSVRVWRCEVCAPIEQVRSLAERRTTRELSAEERATYLGE